MGRKAHVTRRTEETNIAVAIELEGRGEAKIVTPVGFFNHMLNTLARHSKMDLEVEAKGDVEVDFHHLVEDTGIVLGQALDEALGDKKGIARFGEALVPMDEALALAALDLSGREHLSFTASFTATKVGDFDTELVREFFYGLVRGGKFTLHLRLLDGTNTHHAIEALFKAFAKALDRATKVVDTRGSVPSTKGVL
ncbi:MAG: imidazoleglycerol-phosphate dehydratase HisB [Aquificota bacterium]|nr:MAG: imidazoleglycerol-phosphate dehydratase HisB [Aquificota bacterium]